MPPTPPGMSPQPPRNAYTTRLWSGFGLTHGPRDAHTEVTKMGLNAEEEVWQEMQRWLHQQHVPVGRNMPVFGMGVARRSGNIEGVCPHVSILFYFHLVSPPTHHPPLSNLLLDSVRTPASSGKRTPLGLWVNNVGTTTSIIRQQRNVKVATSTWGNRYVLCYIYNSKI